MPQIVLRDVCLLSAARVVRLSGYGLLSVILVLYLAELGLEVAQIGLLLTPPLIGDTAVSLWVTTRDDWRGRRKTWVVGAILVVLAAVVFGVTDSFALLLLAATVGIIGPSGNEVGPLLSIEQAALAQVVPDQKQTRTLAWYALLGSLATAVGALAGGFVADLWKLGVSHRWRAIEPWWSASRPACTLPHLANGRAEQAILCPFHGEARRTLRGSRGSQESLARLEP